MVVNGLTLFCLCTAVGVSTASPLNTYWLPINGVPEEVLPENTYYPSQIAVQEVAVPQNNIPEIIYSQSNLLPQNIPMQRPEGVLPEIIYSQNNPVPLNIPMQRPEGVIPEIIYSQNNPVPLNIPMQRPEGVIPEIIHSQNNPVPLNIPMQGPEYNQFSTCFYVNLKSSTPVTEQIPILSYFAGDAKTAEIIFQLENERATTGLYIGGGNGAYFPMAPSPDQWTHICLTWDGSSGLVSAFVDGVSIGVANDVQTGYQIPGQGSLNVGLPQPDAGEVTQLHFWDRVISPEEVQQALQCTLTGNILAWNPSILGQQGAGFPEGLPATCFPVQLAN